jgi:hypothetical protein
VTLRFVSANILLDTAPPLHHDFTGPPPHRRSTFSSRARRSSLNTRPNPPGLSRDADIEAIHNSNGHLLGYRTTQEPAEAAENGLARPLPKILSMELVEHYSLSIKIEDLPDQDRGESAANTFISPQISGSPMWYMRCEIGMRQMANIKFRVLHMLQ